MRLIHETEEEEEQNGETVKVFREREVQLPPTANPQAFARVANRRNFIHRCYHDEGNGKPCKREEF